MTLPVVWLSEAIAELKEARGWYDDIRPELGNRFARAIQTTVEDIAENSLRFPVVHRQVRRAGVRRFPHALFFEVEEHQIAVIACFHGKRDPQRWHSR